MAARYIGEQCRSHARSPSKARSTTVLFGEVSRVVNMFLGMLGPVEEGILRGSSDGDIYGVWRRESYSFLFNASLPSHLLKRLLLLQVPLNSECVRLH